MIFDLHCHYPMHVIADSDTLGLMTKPGAPSLGIRIRRALLRFANKIMNYPGKGDQPAITHSSLAQSNVRVALSMLFAPSDEMDFNEPYGAPPQPVYFDNLYQQIKDVENDVARFPELALVKSHAELAAAQSAGRVALIHAIEGGYHVGATPEAVRANVATLKQLGVASITVAHLFWRRVATNSNALPFIGDFLYSFLFHQPRRALTALGEAMITAMIENRILVDLTHMSRRSIDATLEIFDRLDPQQTVPVWATHSACRALSPARYNISDAHIAAVVRRGGVVGLIACKHWMARGMRQPETFADTMDIICRHLEHIRKVAGDPEGVHRFSAFGSDQDGFIKPALPGLDGPGGFVQVEQELERRYGAIAAANICSGNALRVLQSW